MTSQMSHTKSIAQINCTIESHKTGHKWDDIMHKNQKFMALRNLWRYGCQEQEICMKIADLLGNLTNDAF